VQTSCDLVKGEKGVCKEKTSGLWVFKKHADACVAT
jgi:hypothetical protein